MSIKLSKSDLILWSKILIHVFIILIYLIEATDCEYDKRVITSLMYSKNRNNVVPTIVNGQRASSGEVPYLVSLKEPVHTYEDGKIVWKNLCGGTIIDAERVLTAAHCFETSDFFFAKHPEMLRYVGGNLRSSLVHSGLTETTTDGQWRRLIKVVIHKDFIFPTNDIAVTIVDVPWRFSGNVGFIRMASNSEMDHADYCAAAGYGRIGPSLRDAISPVLLVARISVLPRSVCSLLWEMNMNTFVCSDTAVTDVARGDSGGPLVCHGTQDPKEKNGEDILVGVVSGKNYDKTTLYTRVAAYRSWIEHGYANDGKSFVSNARLMITLSVLIKILFYYVFIYRLILV